MLSADIDLTENRDFQRNFSATFNRDAVDLLAYESTRSLVSVAWGIGEGGEIELSAHKLYPWNVYELDSDTRFPEILHSEDALSRELGFEFWDDVDTPFILGNLADRMFAKRIIAEEYGGVCYECGKKLTVFDEFVGYLYQCRTCFYNMPRTDFPWNLG